jgi:hypothetical protein
MSRPTSRPSRRPCVPFVRAIVAPFVHAIVVPFVHAIVALVVGGAALSPAAALTLTFTGLDVGEIDQGYGNRVAATPQDGRYYGADGGFTPNVEVSYGPEPAGQPSIYYAGYGDLLWSLYDANTGFGLLEVTLAADSAWTVSLHGFDVAAWNAVAPINAIRVWNGQGHLLYADEQVTIPDEGHTAIRFDPPLEGETLVVGIDSSNLQGFSDHVAIDNITFSQVSSVVPAERASWSALKETFRTPSP